MSRHIGGRELLGPALERIQALQGYGGGEQLYLHKIERQNKTKHKTSNRRIYREGGRLGVWAGNRSNLEEEQPDSELGDGVLGQILPLGPSGDFKVIVVLGPRLHLCRMTGFSQVTFMSPASSA